jgi:hypothetical protein
VEAVAAAAENVLADLAQTEDAKNQARDGDPE